MNLSKFAANARDWKHLLGGSLIFIKLIKIYTTARDFNVSPCTCLDGTYKTLRLPYEVNTALRELFRSFSLLLAVFVVE